MNGVKCPHCGAYTVNEPIQVEVTRMGDFILNTLLSPGGICIGTCRACTREFISGGGVSASAVAAY